MPRGGACGGVRGRPSTIDCPQQRRRSVSAIAAAATAVAVAVGVAVSTAQSGCRSFSYSARLKVTVTWRCWIRSGPLIINRYSVFTVSDCWSAVGRRHQTMAMTDADVCWLLSADD